MDAVERHALEPDASFDGGDLDCGNGLLLLIRQHIDPLDARPAAGDPLDRDLGRGGPARLVPADRATSWSRCVRRGRAAQLPRPQGPARRAGRARGAAAARASRPRVARSPSAFPTRPAAAAPAPPLPPLSVMGIGSWPRPRWLLRALHDAPGRPALRRRSSRRRRRRRRLAVAAQERAGRRTSSPTASSGATTTPASSAAGSTTASSSRSPTCCRYVDDPEQFEAELRALDVPAGEVRHPAVFGRLGRSRPLAVHELAFARVAHRPAGEGGPARAVPADADDVAGVRLRPGVPRPRGAGRRTSCASCARRSHDLLAAGAASCSSTSRC